VPAPKCFIDATVAIDGYPNIDIARVKFLGRLRQSCLNRAKYNIALDVLLA